MSTYGGGPAFPCEYANDGGMSLRDYFAAKAMAALMSAASDVESRRYMQRIGREQFMADLATSSYYAADCMLKARQE